MPQLCWRGLRPVAGGGRLGRRGQMLPTALQAGSAEWHWQIDNPVDPFQAGRRAPMSQDKPAEAAAQFEVALKMDATKGDRATLCKYLGDALACEGNAVAAENEYARAEQLLPGDSGLRQQIAASRTLAQLRKTLKIGPTPEMYSQLAGDEANQGLARDALEHYLAALKLKPDSPEILNNLAWLLATSLDRKVRDGTGPSSTPATPAN